jgi:hypothetical protein
MVTLRNTFVAGPVALLLALLVVCFAALTWEPGASAQGASAPVSAAPTATRTVADTGQGELRSRIIGTTGNGRRVTGSFVPLRFVQRNNRIQVRGLVQGVVHNANGSTRTFGVLRTLNVRTINGAPARATSGQRQAQRAACDVLNLVLGPLDLNLLGLQVDLNRIVLNIVAQSGAGNLLGNLLCAVAGLLDGGLSGLLGRVTRLLNRALGQLGLGL